MDVQALIDNFVSVLKKYKDFAGRARRREYWLFVLCNVIISIALSILGMIPVLGILFAIASFAYFLLILVPGIAVSIRRLHDIDKSGWYLLISLIPIAGFIILLIWTVKEGTAGDNKYGPNPKA